MTDTRPLNEWSDEELVATADSLLQSMIRLSEWINDDEAIETTRAPDLLDTEPYTYTDFVGEIPRRAKRIIEAAKK